MSDNRGRFLFGGTFGQTALLVSAALLIAQGAGFFLLVNERDRWRLLDAVQPAVERFVSAAGDVARAKPNDRMAMTFRISRPDEHFLAGPRSAIEFFHLVRESELEARLSAALQKSGLRANAVEASSVGFANSPRQNRPHPLFFHRMFANRGPDGLAGPMLPPEPGFGPPHGLDRDGQHHQEIDLSVQLTDGTWINGQFFSMRPTASFIGRIALAELIFFAVVLTVTLILAMRLARPMLQLAHAADRMTPDQSPAPVPESGPSDIRAAIRSFNAMTKRVTELLREKDRMLGAIGHDLRTPLASMRIRAEAVESDVERERLIETIDDMTRMIDEILDFARLNYAGEKFAAVDLAALADSVVEEFRELGKDATFIDGPRAVVRIQPFLMRRLLRNLIENGIKFGDSVQVSVEPRGIGGVTLAVSDHGPGIPEDALDTVVEPFSRLETSRNKDTGGVGLGLSIAAAIARHQGATLVLKNRTGGGLTAQVIWPAEDGPLPPCPPA